LCAGGGPRDEDAVDEIVAAIVRAVRDGRLSEARVEEAASRVRHVAAVPASLLAARRAVSCDGDVHVGREASVVRLASPPSFAAGEVPWGMADALAARGVRITDGDGRLVIVVRDLHRQPENQRRVDELLARQPDAILVEMGVPVCRPHAARNYVATYGSAQVCARAAAERMT
jgi:beta-N-acetylhexosaminidase